MFARTSPTSIQATLSMTRSNVTSAICNGGGYFRQSSIPTRLTRVPRSRSIVTSIRTFQQRAIIVKN